MENECGISNVALSSALRACGEGLQWQKAQRDSESPLACLKALELLHCASAPDAELFNARIEVF